MKRDMDIIRKILLDLEQFADARAPSEIKIPGHDEQTIDYHLWLMIDAGLLDGKQYSSSSKRWPTGLPTTIRWAGYEFLDAARSETLWNRAKSHFGSTLSSVPFCVLKTLLEHYVKNAIGLQGE